MNFASDNAGPAHPTILQAIVAANAGYAMPYGADPIAERALDRVREVFEAPDASVRLVATGTAANALALATLVRPWQTVFCHRTAHIEVDECGAVEAFSGGAKLTLVDGPDGKMDPGALEAAIAGAAAGGVHGVQPGAVSLTSVSEVGTVLTPDEIAARTGVAKAHGLPVHLDGARFANACAALGCTPAEITWKAGIDAVSFGGTKNGCLAVEAVVFFDAGRDWEMQLRRKRAGHLWSKHRYLSAQIDAYLTDGLWLTMAQAANAGGRRIAEAVVAAGGRLAHPAEANIVFADLPRAAHARAFAAGARYYLFPPDVSLDGPADDPVRARIVADWSCPPDRIDRLAAAWRS